MKILVASTNDYANLGHNVGRSLRSVGVECTDVCLAQHLFKYDSMSKYVNVNQLKALIREHDHVLIMHSDQSILYHVQHQGKPYSVYHTGTRYRENPTKFNALFQSAVHVLSDQTEFMALAPRAKYVVSAIDEFEFIPRPQKRKLVIGHFPSVAEVKGTDMIRKMLEPFKAVFEIRIDTRKVSHAENIQRMQDIDIYIELFQPVLWGKNYGCFGVTAIEAAMMGKAVITMDVEYKSHVQTYGPHPFYIANTEASFAATLNLIKTYGYDGAGIHTAAKKYYSFAATGTRLKKIFGLREWPKVSVLIPFNVDRGWLKDAKESVHNQRYGGEIELLCSDNLVDGHEGFNVSRNINELLKEATGEYIKFFAEDDLLTPNCVHDSVVAIETQGVDFIHGNSFILRQGQELEYSRLQVQRPVLQTPTFDQHCEQCYMHGLTLFYHRRVFDSGIRFDETLTCSEENDFNLNAMSKGFVLGYIDKTLGVYRRHKKQKSLGEGVDQKRRAKEVEMIRSRYRRKA